MKTMTYMFTLINDFQFIVFDYKVRSVNEILVIIKQINKATYYAHVGQVKIEIHAGCSHAKKLIKINFSHFYEVFYL